MFISHLGIKTVEIFPTQVTDPRTYLQTSCRRREQFWRQNLQDTGTSLTSTPKKALNIGTRNRNPSTVSILFTFHRDKVYKYGILNHLFI